MKELIDYNLDKSFLKIWKNKHTNKATSNFMINKIFSNAYLNKSMFLKFLDTIILNLFVINTNQNIKRMNKASYVYDENYGISSNSLINKKIIILDSNPELQYGGGQIIPNYLFKYLSKKFDVKYIADKTTYDPFYPFVIPTYSKLRIIPNIFFKSIKIYRKHYSSTKYKINNNENNKSGRFDVQYRYITKTPIPIVRIFANKNAIRYIEDADIIISNSPFDLFILRAVNIKGKRIIKINHLPLNLEAERKILLFLKDLCTKKGAELISVVLSKSQIKLSEDLKVKTIWIPNGIQLINIPNIVQLDILDKFNLKNKKFLLSVGRLVDWQKGFSLIIKLMPKIKDKDLIYIIAGTGPDEDYYRNLIDTLSLKDRVKLIGFVSDLEKLALIKSSFAFIQPSYFESFSLVTLEALSQGAIVLVSKNEGSIDIIKDGENGFFIEMNEKDIINKIELIEKMNEKEREKIKINAINTAQLYSIENMISKYVQLIY